MKPYDVAGWEKSLLTKQAQKDVTKIYKESADEVEKLLENFKVVNPSDKLRKLYLEDLKSQISGVYSQASQGIYQDIVQNSLKSAKLAVDGHVKTMSGVGFNIGGAFSYIPRQEVQRIIGGKIYDGSWSLSKAIWRAEQKTNQDINYILAKGLAENRTIEELSNDLMTFVRPDAVKPWEWKKVYPNTGKSIEYNSQRLARTMIQHSFQSAMVRAERKNPFCEGIRWHSAEIHGRTCDLCRDRDGQVFTVRNLPYDHPNGLCWYEPELEDLNSISDRLAKWANGEEDGNIDAYIKDAFGLDPKSLLVNRSAYVTSGATKRAKPARVKSKNLEIADKNAYIDKNFKTLKKHAESTSYGKDYWVEIKEAMTKMDSLQLRYMQLSQDKLAGFKNELYGGAYYPDTREIEIDIVNRNKDPRGGLQAFFHEYGHHLDFTVKDGKKSVFTDDPKFRSELYKRLDADAVANVFEKGSRNLRADVRKDLLQSHASSGVQDTISGLTKNKSDLLWYHSKEYWEIDPQFLGAEFVANSNVAWADPEAGAYMEKYFPTAYQFWKDTVKEIVLKKGV